MSLIINHPLDIGEIDGANIISVGLLCLNHLVFGWLSAM